MSTSHRAASPARRAGAARGWSSIAASACRRPAPFIASRALAAMLNTARRSLSVSRAAITSAGRSDAPQHGEPRQLALEAAEDLLDQERDVHRPPRELAPGAREVEGLAGHAVEAIHHRDDRLRAVARRVRRGLVAEDLRVAADDRHRGAEVVGEHARHRPQRGHALGGHQLPAGTGGSRARGRTAWRGSTAGAPRRGAAAASSGWPPAGRGRASPPARSAPASGTSTPSPPWRVSRISPSLSRNPASGAGTAAVPGRNGADLRLTTREGLEAVELAVPEEQGGPVHVEGGGQLAGEDAREVVGAGGFQHAVQETAQRGGARGAGESARRIVDTQEKPSL